MGWLARWRRFTPTGVGTITVTSERRAAPTVHPHGRGDNARLVGGADRARRFTPTGVGTIAEVRLWIGSRTVHPHGRGDNHPDTRTARAPSGSPPRAWGQSVNAPSISWYVRFTPTGVGTMLRRVGRCGSASVHPHGRGDNLGARMLGRIVNGSPPRAWGQCWHEHPYADDVRFTPTGVGTIGC